MALSQNSGVFPRRTCGPAGFRRHWSGADINQLACKDFLQHTPDDARIMVRWWWFGPAVTREGIERELKAMKAGGIGGVELQCTYPLAAGWRRG